MLVALSHLAFTDAYWLLLVFLAVLTFFSGLFCRGRPTGPATLAFMLLGRFCAGRLNFSRLKYQPRRWDPGPASIKNVAFRTVIAHRCSIQHSKNGVRIDCDRRKMQLVWPVFWILSCVVFYQSYKLKEESGFGSRMSTVWRKLNQPFQPKVPHQDQESTKFLSHCFSRDKLHLWDSNTFLLWVERSKMCSIWIKHCWHTVAEA